ncbi:MAG TPA: hypothetical protein VM618_09835 [Acidimicrobiia bacterium]|nr:hypothetical protein [Acidimicrobiia bacterium]
MADFEGSSGPRWWQITLSLILVAVGMAGIVLLTRSTVRTFQSLESEIAVAIVTAFAAVVVAVAGAVLNRRFERHRQRSGLSKKNAYRSTNHS